MTSEDPLTRRDDTLDELHGRFVADPYRWLEDADAPETAEWVVRQNLATEAHLSTLADRDWFSATMTAVVGRPRAGVPSVKGGHYFVTRNDGTQNQDVVYVADSLAELLEGGRVIIDPNTFSVDGTSSLNSFSVSDDGVHLTYTVSEGGSDWVDFVLVDVATGERVLDAPIQTKFSSPQWLPDSRSYLYNDFPHAGHAAGTQTDSLGGARLRIHRIGTEQADDPVVLEFPGQERLMFWGEVSHDDAYVVVSLVEGTENRNRVWVYRITETDGISTLSSPVKLVDEAVAELGFVRSDGPRLLFSTDLDAPRGRVVSLDLDAFELSGVLDPVEVLPEGQTTLLGAQAVGDVLVALSLADAQPVITRVSLDGADRGIVDVPGGSVVALSGEPGDLEGFVGMSSVTAPTIAYRFDSATGEVIRLDGLVRGGAGAFVAPEVRWTEEPGGLQPMGSQGVGHNYH